MLPFFWGKIHKNRWIWVSHLQTVSHWLMATRRLREQPSSSTSSIDFHGAKNGCPMTGSYHWLIPQIEIKIQLLRGEWVDRVDQLFTQLQRRNHQPSEIYNRGQCRERRKNDQRTLRKKVGKPEEKPKESRDAQQKYRHLTLALHLFPSSLACCPIYFHHFSPSFSAVGFWMFLASSTSLDHSSISLLPFSPDKAKAASTGAMAE